MSRFAKIFGTDWKSPKRWYILGGIVFVLFGCICFLLVRATESVIAHDEDSPLTIMLSPEVLQASFDKDKQSHMLTAEFKILDAEKAEKSHDYKAAHKAFSDAVDELVGTLGKGSQFTRLIMYRAGAFEADFHRPKLAQSYFERAIAEPIDASTSRRFLLTTRIWLSRCLERQGLYKQEIECCKKAMEIAKTRPGSDDNNVIDALCELGSAQNHLDDNEALKTLNEAVSIIQKQKRAHKNDQRDSSAYLLRGYCLMTLQRDAEALIDLNSAVALDAEDMDALAYRGSALTRLGKYQEALKDFDQVLQSKHKLAWIYFRRGKALSELKEHERAIDDFKEAAARSRSHDVVVPPDTTEQVFVSLKEAAIKALEQQKSLLQVTEP
ncbi:MAG: tetratricopeptide repeat protein [Cyanobacteria bacterium SZAS-4]|nr:tetratricopeptide repeat protein [Cyanobacteria bacterium SZAS-4]